ncbi:hypothetical protein EMIT043CA1_30050 [Pseudomonas brassicacearum]
MMTSQPWAKTAAGLAQTINSRILAFMSFSLCGFCTGAYQFRGAKKAHVPSVFQPVELREKRGWRSASAELG